MKSFFLTTILLCMCLIGYAQDKPKVKTSTEKTTIKVGVNTSNNDDSDGDDLGDTAINIMPCCDDIDNDCDGVEDETLKKGMNKGELIDAIAKEVGLSKADAKKALEAITGAITMSLKKGDNVQLIGFGTFSISTRAAYNCKDPKTGETIKIAAKKVAKIKAGKALADTVK